MVGGGRRKTGARRDGEILSSAKPAGEGEERRQTLDVLPACGGTG